MSSSQVFYFYLTLPLLGSYNDVKSQMKDYFAPDVPFRWLFLRFFLVLLFSTVMFSFLTASVKYKG